MQMGVDATKLDLFAESGNDNGFMAPLFELSCSEGKKFKYKKVHDFNLTLNNLQVTESITFYIFFNG